MKIILLLFIFITLGLGQGALEKHLISYGLIDLGQKTSEIKVKLVNSNPDWNFFRKDLYGGLKKAYLRPEVTEKLVVASSLLRKKNSRYSLQIMDAARPLSVSVMMYNQMKGTPYEHYVANPATGSFHNYGVAVDITIVNEKGEMIDMGPCPFYKSTIGILGMLISTSGGKRVTPAQQANRELLKKVMTDAGFIPLSFEWWHFDGMDHEKTRANFRQIP